MTHLHPATGTPTTPPRDQRASSWRAALLERQARLWESIRTAGPQPRTHLSGRATYVAGEALAWLAELPAHSLHAVVTDPPYGLIEYGRKHHDKLKNGRGGVWRIPPSFDGTAATNLRRWGAGGLRRVSADEPFKDVILCSPTRGREREIAPHPSLKPQRFLRQVVRAALPLGIGIVYDPVAGSGSTLAAAEALGYIAIGTDRDPGYYVMATRAFGPLAALSVGEP